MADKTAEISIAMNSSGFVASSASSKYDGKSTKDQFSSDSAYPAFAYCNGYVDTAGNNDYYPPSQLELEILYRSSKPTTDANNTAVGANPNAVPATNNYTSLFPAQTTDSQFTIGQAQALQAGAYWSSTWPSQTNVAWVGDFLSGAHSTATRSNSRLLRPIRRVIIPGQ